MHGGLKEAIERLSLAADADRDEARAAVGSLLDALEEGTLRAAMPTQEGWIVNAWVKRGLLLAFRCGVNVSLSLPPFHFRDRDTLPSQDPARGGRNIRVVPGGSTVRRGAFLDDGVVLMPPAFVNVGAHVGPGTMIDSHALVGSCAQIGARVHLSAAVQVGGVLEPPGAMPVIVEDEAFVGGGCGLYEGTRVGRRAVLAPGVVLTRAVALYDLARERTIVADGSGVLAVPESAVVVPGTRPAGGDWAHARGLSLYAPVIVKYRDAQTDAAAALEDGLR
jgi:2,3,4,5-tetrahydropyridine-2,6-dicarboxylate N-succinyltransferase